MQYNWNLEKLVGAVLKRRPGLDRFVAKDLLNERMRSALDRRVVWSGTLRRATIGIPNTYTTGTIDVTPGSVLVNGTGTAWPVSDVVSTTITDNIPTATQKWVSLASMTGVTLDTVLYVDSNGPSPEWCPVLDISGGRILANFAYPHAAQTTATAGSLNGLQLMVGGYLSPVFSVITVTSPTTLILDRSWGAAASTGTGYNIAKVYTTIDPNIKGILLATDPFQQIPLRCHVSQEELNQFDPNRTATNSPTCLADAWPNVNGNQQYEIYPPQLSSYQLNVLYHVSWPDMRLPGDYPPPFLNPNVLIYGALADAYRTPCPLPPDNKDPGFNAESAAHYDALFERSVFDAISADESKYQTMFEYNYSQMWGGFTVNSNWLVSHDVDALTGNY